MSEAGGPQFDRAEFENTPAVSQCASCSRPLAGYYFEANGVTVCEACRYALEARWTGGSRAGRALRAIAAGTMAALLGALLYYGIAVLTGYEFGLIAIVVGYGVGVAVRWGSQARGGWAYQTLAIALTYLAIVSTYIPPILKGLSAAEAAQTQEVAPSPSGETAAVTPAAVQSSTTAEPQLSTGGLAMAFAFLLAIAIVAPFLAGIQNIMGLIIIAIGLYEAWKLNKRTELTITGPHTLAKPAGA